MTKICTSQDNRMHKTQCGYSIKVKKIDYENNKKIHETTQ